MPVYYQMKRKIFQGFDRYGSATLLECSNLFRIMISLIVYIFGLRVSEYRKMYLIPGGIIVPKKEKEIDLNNLTPQEEMKYEIAKELGLLDKVLTSGWKSLSAKETGRIGGLITKKRAKNVEKGNEMQ